MDSTSNKSLFPLIALMLSILAATNALALDNGKGYGEPYAPAGKRIVFTTWYWVRPGQHDWLNAEGKSVYADTSVMAGPFDAHFVNIDGPTGVRLIAEPAQRGGKLPVKSEFPWEAGGVTIDQLLPLPDGKIMAWGDCIDEATKKKRGCYLESTDGVNWTRPKVGLVEFNGSKENNLLLDKPSGRVFFDPHGKPQERFKSATNGRMPRGEFEKLRQTPAWRDHPISALGTERHVEDVDCIFGFTSPDGLRWTKIEQPLAVQYSDGDQIVYWDPLLNKYVMYSRTYAIVPRADGYAFARGKWHTYLGRRVIGRAESSDFRSFPPAETVIEGSTDMAPTDTYYFGTRTTIPGAPDFHLMFPSRYVIDDDNTAIDLFTSFDGKTWHRAPGSPLLRTADFGQWDGGFIFANVNLIERAGGDWVLLYRGAKFPHKYPRGEQVEQMGTAVWPRGRLMAIEAPTKGAFTTPAFLAPGTKMRINALTSRVGEIRVEAADFDGKTLPGRSFDDSIPIVGDQYRTPVAWTGGDTLGVELSKPVVLRFRMEKAKIYGLDFE